MAATRWLRACSAAVVAMAVLDALWLGLVARGFYVQELGDLMAARVKLFPALVFYLGYPVGVAYLVLQPGAHRWHGAAGRAAVVGALAYGTYDMTNWATLEGWSATLSLVDMAWGVFASALVGVAAWQAGRPR